MTLTNKKTLGESRIACRDFYLIMRNYIDGNKTEAGGMNVELDI